MDMTLIIMAAVLTIASSFGLGYFFYHNNITKQIPKKFPYQVLIRMRRGDTGYYASMDRAKALYDENKIVTMFQLRKAKRTIKPINFQYIQHYGQEGAGGFIELYMPNRDEYVVTKFDPNISSEVKIISEDNRRWAVMAIRRAYEQFGQQNKLLAYMPLIAIVVVLIITILILVYGWQNIASVTNTAISASANAGQNPYMANITEYLRIIAHNTTQTSYATGG